MSYDPKIVGASKRLIGLTQRMLDISKRMLRPMAVVERRIAQIEAQQRNIESFLRSAISEIEARFQSVPTYDSLNDLVSHAFSSQILRPEEVDNALRKLGQTLLDKHPHYSYFNLRLRDYELAILNIKNLGYELGRSLANRKPSSPQSGGPSLTPLKSKLCTQGDFESEWFSYWCQEIRTAVIYHRKIWEFCYICQALFVERMLAPGNRGLGFGCGTEPLPSLFAKYGVKVLATDLDPSRREAEVWQLTGQHSATVETFRRRDICPDEALLANIDYRPVDMNAIPEEFDGQFDFCWSSCSLEHLGSLARGLEFIENSLRTLRPGGIAVHTTEFTFDEGETIDNWPTVIYQKGHLVQLAELLREKGYEVMDFDFDPGSGILDRFVDLPPWSREPLTSPQQDAHLKLSVDGFTCTSAGIIIKA